MEKPRDIQISNVRDALEEILDLSGLVLDLAFASVIYENKELAQEVLDLERYIDKLSDAITIHMSLAVTDREDAEKAMSVFKASNIADQISDAAAEIAKITLRDLKLHPLLREALFETEETVEIFSIEETSRLPGYSLEETRMKSGVGFDAIAIKRDFRWLINPEDNFKFLAKDTVVIRGSRDAIDQILLFTRES